MHLTNISGGRSSVLRPSYEHITGQLEGGLPNVGRSLLLEELEGPLKRGRPAAEDAPGNSGLRDVSRAGFAQFDDYARPQLNPASTRSKRRCPSKRARGTQKPGCR